MTVFKGYLKGALRQRTIIILYLVIFLGLGMLMTMTMDDANNQDFTSEKMTMTVIDRDHSALSEGLESYMAGSQNLVSLEDRPEVLKEELYYGNIQYALVIPEGFEEAFVKETIEEKPSKEGLLQGTGRPGSTQSHYAAELADSYLSGIGFYLRSGYSPEEAVTHMHALQTEKVTAVMKEGSNSMSKVAGTLQYLPFVLTALACYVIGFVMLDYQRLDIRRRLSVSAVSPANRTAQMLLAILVIGGAFYVVSIFMTAIMNPGTILEEPNRLYYMGNMAVMVLVALSSAFFVVSVARSGNGVNGMANVIALGMSFICGVFIPESMLSTSVRRVAKFLPVYWYEQNNTILGTHSVLSDMMKEQWVKGCEKQLIFAAVVLIAALVINKIREKH